MRIKDVPTSDLQRSLAATERMVGPYSYEARVLRRELERRELERRERADRRRARQKDEPAEQVEAMLGLNVGTITERGDDDHGAGS